MKRIAPLFEPLTQGKLNMTPEGAVVSKGRKMKEEMGEGSTGDSCGRFLQPWLQGCPEGMFISPSVFHLCSSLAMNKPGTWNWVYKPFWPFQGMDQYINRWLLFSEHSVVCACTGLYILTVNPICQVQVELPVIFPGVVNPINLGVIWTGNNAFYSMKMKLLIRRLYRQYEISGSLNEAGINNKKTILLALAVTTNHHAEVASCNITFGDKSLCFSDFSVEMSTFVIPPWYVASLITKYFEAENSRCSYSVQLQRWFWCDSKVAHPT